MFKTFSGRFTKSVPSKVTLKVKGGTAVDPDSELEDVAHVYKKGSDVYSTVLGLTDLQSGTNKYYKLQILESDKGHRSVVLRACARARARVCVLSLIHI